jgi:hypothetical protein
MTQAKMGVRNSALRAVRVWCKQGRGMVFFEVTPNRSVFTISRLRIYGQGQVLNFVTDGTVLPLAWAMVEPTGGMEDQPSAKETQPRVRQI